MARIAFRTKGAVLDSLVEDRIAANASHDPETARLTARLRLLSRQLEAPSSAAGENRGQLAAEQIKLQAALSDRIFGTDASRRALRADPASIRAALPRNAVLVEWIRYNAYEGKLRWKPAYGALVVSPEGPIRWVPLGDATAIDAAVRLDQKAMRHRMSDDGVSRALRNLYERIWAPLAPTLPAETQRIVISPDGELNFVSFATLLTPDGRFLSDSFTIEYVSSGRDLIRDLPQPKEGGAKKLSVFADPDFGGVKTDMDADLDPLPGTRKEARFLLDHAAAWGLVPDAHLGPDASKRALEALRSPYILHLATHARILDTDSFPGFSPPNPMQRNLIFLTGAQATLDAWRKGTPPPPENDGILNAEEAGTLDLEGTWLVTLSACDTGGGEALAGEGVLGLRRGFLLAGARNLMMTLWPVSDEATVPMIEDFYTRTGSGEGAGTALAEAQRRRLHLLRDTEGIGAAARKAGAFILSF